MDGSVLLDKLIYQRLQFFSRVSLCGFWFYHSVVVWEDPIQVDGLKIDRNHPY